MNTRDFMILNGDTDSVSIYKKDFLPFGKDERSNLLNELNEQCPEGLTWEDDGNYKVIIVVRAKNYILLSEEGKLTIKGSGLKASGKSPKLKKFILDIIDGMLYDKNNALEIYNKYIKEVNNIIDMKEWSIRKTISERVLESDRKNELNVRDAIVGTELVAGDRCTMFYKEDGTLCLTDKFNGDYSRTRLYQNIYDTMKIFAHIINMSHFLNYKLKKNKKLLALL